MVIAAPWLAVIAAIAGVVAKVKLEIVRDAEPETESPEPDDEAAAPPTDTAPTP